MSLKETVKMGLVLFIVIVLSALLLGYVEGLTRPIIEKKEGGVRESAALEMFPHADNIRDMQGYREVLSGGQVIGYLVESSSFGYSSEIRVMMAIAPDGSILGVKIMGHQDTPGIGTRIEEPEFLEMFAGRKDVEGIDAITGATRSSAAVKRAVQEGLEAVR